MLTLLVWFREKLHGWSTISDFLTKFQNSQILDFRLRKWIENLPEVVLMNWKNLRSLCLYFKQKVLIYKLLSRIEKEFFADHLSLLQNKNSVLLYSEIKMLINVPVWWLLNCCSIITCFSLKVEDQLQCEFVWRSSRHEFSFESKCNSCGVRFDYYRVGTRSKLLFWLKCSILINFFKVFSGQN